MTIVIGILHYFISIQANKFADVFDEFGTELPWITSFIVYNPVYYWGIPILAALFFIAHHMRIISRATVILATSLITLASIIFTIIAVYLPIFKLGTVVQ